MVRFQLAGGNVLIEAKCTQAASSECTCSSKCAVSADVLLSCVKPRDAPTSDFHFCQVHCVIALTVTGLSYEPIHFRYICYCKYIV
jgi:hypothetical protein